MLSYDLGLPDIIHVHKYRACTYGGMQEICSSVKCTE